MLNINTRNANLLVLRESPGSPFPLRGRWEEGAVSGGYYQVKVMSGALSYKTTDALSSHSSGLGTQCIYSS